MSSKCLADFEAAKQLSHVECERPTFYQISGDQCGRYWQTADGFVSALAQAVGLSFIELQSLAAAFWKPRTCQP